MDDNMASSILKLIIVFSLTSTVAPDSTCYYYTDVNGKTTAVRLQCLGLKECCSEHSDRCCDTEKDSYSYTAAVTGVIFGVCLLVGIVASMILCCIMNNNKKQVVVGHYEMQIVGQAQYDYSRPAAYPTMSFARPPPYYSEPTSQPLGNIPGAAANTENDALPEKVPL